MFTLLHHHYISLCIYMVVYTNANQGGDNIFHQVTLMEVTHPHIGITIPKQHKYIHLRNI